MEDIQAVKTRILDLSRKLEDYAYHYYVLSRPLISDLEYDRLFDQLSGLEAAHPELVLPWSPTQRVGSDLSHELEEQPHSLPVLSLDKAYTPEELASWAQKTQKAGEESLVFSLEEKLDGVSIVLYYVEGILDRALTRGNGMVGNVVTSNVKTIPKVPLRLPQPLTLAVRGEIFIRKSQFDRVNKGLAEPYSNPRNLAAGTLRRIVSRDVARIPLDIYIYEGFFDPPLGTNREIREKLAALGFPLNPRFTLFNIPGQGPALEDLPDFVEKARMERSGLDYEIDGLVMKVDSLGVRDRLGMTGHHPRWAVAFKFESPQAQTVVESIDVQVGRTGRITPVARVRPVALGGAVISNVTLHNQDYIESLELGIGDQVTVSRRGDVIPAVEEVTEKISDHVWAFPSRCPSCGGGLTKDGAHHFCLNSQCPDQVRGRLNFFAAKDQMDLAGLGPETMDVLVREGLVTGLVDIFTADFSRLTQLSGFGEKKVAALTQGIEQAKTRSFEVLLPSLGLPELGKKVLQLLVEHGVSTWEDLETLAGDETLKSFTNIPGIGEKTAEVLRRSILDPQTKVLIQSLRALGFNLRAQGSAGPSSQEWAGQIWCVTGSFEAFNPRSKAEALIRDRGARVVSAVSGSTTHLLAGTASGSKLAKAQAVGAKIVSEQDFLKLLG